jgi:hypothetical protein
MQDGSVRRPGIAAAPDGYPALRQNILADLPAAADAGAENLPAACNHDQENPVTGYNSLLIKKGRFRPVSGGTEQEKKCWDACVRSSTD